MTAFYRKVRNYRRAQARKPGGARRAARNPNPGPSRAVLVDGARFASIAEAGRELEWATASGLGQAARSAKPYKGHVVEFAPEKAWEPMWKEAS